MYSGRRARVSATSTFWQAAKSRVANKHGVVVLGHTMRFCIQGVARVTQQVHDADMHHIYLPKLDIFLLLVKEGSEIYGGHRRRWGKPLPLAVFGEVSLAAPISAVMHGKLCYQAHTNLRPGLTFLKNAKEDSVVLVAMPSKPTYSPQPRKGRYLTLLPISSNPDVDRGPLHVFTAAGLPVASKEGCGGDMPVHVKMPSCFGSSKCPKRELMWEPALQRGPLWKNVH